MQTEDMTESPDPPKLSRPTTLRLRQEQLAAIDAIAERRGQLRSELLIEAVDHWLLLYERGLDAARIVAALGRPDRELSEIEDTAAEALEMIQEVRARLIALTLTEPPKIW